MAESSVHMGEKYVHQAYTELNPLTGLYYNKAFFEYADQYLQRVAPNSYCMVAVDIEHFHFFNKLFGREEGDKLLVYIADCVRKIQESYGGVAGYLGGDNFGLLMPDKKEYIRELKTMIVTGIRKWSRTVGFLPAIGVYPIDNNQDSATMMYDRATISVSHVLGNYTKRILIYDSDMEEKMEKELLLLSDIQTALEEDEFTFFVQPQCNITTGKIIGGESLVRWQRKGGMVSPGVFIPILEKNGFIADLDRYVWKKVCKWLRSLIDRGYHPVPVSINVSRIDIFSMDVPAYLLKLLKEYELPIGLLKIEITESAYAENNDKIEKAVESFRNAGFLVMMDDFGSGYSSLNMLKSVSVDVIKIDMRFLDISEKEEERGIDILESVINMARLMELPVIVEGVENQKQENYLIDMGCCYTQGYHYYRPLPVSQFEQILADERNLDFDGLCCKQVEAFHVREFLDETLFSDTVLNNILGPAAFYDIYENQIEILRVNEQYYRLAGVSFGNEGSYEKRLWNHVRDDDRLKLYSMLEQAYLNPTYGAQGNLHFLRTDGKVLWVYCRIYFLRETGGHKVFYSSLVDITDYQKKEHDKGRHTGEKTVKQIDDKKMAQLDKCYGDMPCALVVARLILDDAGQPSSYEPVYMNPEMEKLSGNSQMRLHMLASEQYDEKVARIAADVYRAAYHGEVVNDLIYSSMSGRFLHHTFYPYEYGYSACIVWDETHTHIYRDTLNCVLRPFREVYFLHLQENYSRMIYPDPEQLLDRGNYEEMVNRHFGTGKILKYDEDNIRRFLSLENLKKELEQSGVTEYKYQRRTPENGEEWCTTRVIVCEQEDEKPKTALLMIQSAEE